MSRRFFAAAILAALTTTAFGQVQAADAPQQASAAQPTSTRPETTRLNAGSTAGADGPQIGTPAPATSGSLAAASPDTPPVHAPQPNIAPDYVIGPGDSLEVSVWKEPAVSGTVPVRPDGMISLPLVGDVQASGLTPVHLGQTLTERLRKYINQPDVTVTVLTVKSKSIYLVGEVGKPGELPLTPGMSPLQAIATAGGVTQFTSGKHSYILRGSNGNQQKIPFNYNKAIKDGNLQGVTLQPGDTIVVK